MALSLPSLDIINPQCHQGSFLEGNPETFDFYYDKFPPTYFSLEDNNYQNFCSFMLSFNQIDQILMPCYNSIPKVDEEEECNTLIRTFDQNYLNNSIIGGVGDYMYGNNAQVFSNPTINHAGCVQQSPENDRVPQKRHIEGEEKQISKKQCGIRRKTKEARVSSPLKETQSLAAKNRRERISERLRVLQELVPNGTKVLATNEFWPAQGGNAPDISGFKEAIDAILSSHKNNFNLDKSQTKIEI